MTGWLGPTVLGVLAVWCGVLTVLLLAVLRQIGLIMVRIDGPSFSVHEDGPEVGVQIPPTTATRLSELGNPAMPRLLVLMSATCSPCRELAADLGDWCRTADVGRELTILLSGDERHANALEAMLPIGIGVIRDPAAAEIAESLGIKSVPFGVAVEHATVVAKKYLMGVQDLNGLGFTKTKAAGLGAR